MAKKRTRGGVKLTLERLVALRLPWSVDDKVTLIRDSNGEAIAFFESRDVALSACEAINRHTPVVREMRCAHCSNVVAFPGWSRGHVRKYCSDRCRAYASKRRRQTALDLDAEGFSIEMIARTIGSSRATVRGWLRAKAGDDDGR